MILAATLVGCVAASASNATIDVKGATVVGVYPPVSTDPLDHGDATQIDHLENAVVETKRCLKDRDVTARVILSSSVVLNDAGRKTEIKLPAEYPASVVGILATPGREPQVVRSSYGPNELQLSLPGAARTYFNEPQCLEYP